MKASSTVCRSVHSVIVMALILMIGTTSAWADGPGGSTTTPASTRFGVVEAYFRPADAHELGVGWERIVFEWPRFQPDGPHEFDTEAIPHEWLRDARDSGRAIVGILKNVPFWASGGDLLGLPPQGLDLPIDDPDNYWAAFVRQAVRYYGETWGITHWIIFNEPDIRPGEMDWYEFDGDVHDYYQMLKVAYLAAKAENPDVTIHMAGMAWWVDKVAFRPPYLERLLEIASNDPDAYQYDFFFDVVMVHTYFGTSNVWRMLAETRSILSYYGLYLKEIWVDETNASPSLDPEAPQPDAPYRVTLEQQADYLVQAAALSLAAGVERFAVYRLYDNHYLPGQTAWGLIRVDGTRRPAYDRYYDIIRLFEGTLSASYYYSTRASLVVLRQPERTLYVMWARGETPVQFHIKAPIDGQPEDYGPHIIDFDGTPRQTLTAEYVVTKVSDDEYNFDGWWYPVETAGAVPADDDGNIMVEGPPVIVMADDSPRSVWVLVGGSYWYLR